MAQQCDEYEKIDGKSNIDFMEEMGKLNHWTTMSRRTYKASLFIAQEFDRIRSEIATAKTEREALLRDFDQLLEAMNSSIIPADHNDHRKSLND